MSIPKKQMVIKTIFPFLGTFFKHLLMHNNPFREISRIKGIVNSYAQVCQQPLIMKWHQPAAEASCSRTSKCFMLMY